MMKLWSAGRIVDELMWKHPLTMWEHSSAVLGSQLCQVVSLLGKEVKATALPNSW